MARYRAKALLYVDRLIVEGEEFESNLTPGINWEPLDKDAKAAADNRPTIEVRSLTGIHDTPRTDIPEDWADKKPISIINLARKLGLPQGSKLPDARAWIEREQAARLVPVND